MREIHCTCPMCQYRYRVAFDLVGHNILCPMCDTRYVVCTAKEFYHRHSVTINHYGQPPAARKDVGVAIILAFLFGPLGMLYVTTNGALIMLCVGVPLALCTFGLSLAITWPLCILWAAWAACDHNGRIDAYSRVSG